jgi:hypothetical protein
MLRLSHQIGGDDGGIRRRIRKDQAVGRARDHVDAHTAEQDALGFGDKLVARPHKDIGLWQAEQPEGHRGNALNAPHRQDRIRPADMRGIDDRRSDADTGARRRTGDDMFAACHLGGGHSHDRTGDMAVAPTRNIAACRLDGDAFLTSDQTRNHLHLDILQRGLLGFGKAAHIGVAEFDIALDLLGDEGCGGVNLGFGQDDAAFVFVEFLGVIQCGLIAASLDVIQDGLDDFSDIGRIAFGGQGRFFKILTGHFQILFVDVREQDRGDRRDIGNHQNHDQHEEDERHGTGGDLEDGFARDTRDNEQV